MGNWELGIGHGELGIGHGELGIGLGAYPRTRVLTLRGWKVPDFLLFFRSLSGAESPTVREVSGFERKRSPSVTNVVKKPQSDRRPACPPAWIGMEEHEPLGIGLGSLP